MRFEFTELAYDRALFTFAADDSLSWREFLLESLSLQHREVMQHVVMASLTSFAAVINETRYLVNRTGHYRIFLIIDDGQVPRSMDIPLYGSNFPWSIIMVDVDEGKVMGIDSWL